MTTADPNTTSSPYAGPIFPTDAQPIAWLATTRYTPVREMTEMLTRRFGQGLQVRREHGRTIWLLPVAKQQRPRTLAEITGSGNR